MRRISDIFQNELLKVSTPSPCKEQKSAQGVENKEFHFGTVQKSEDLVHRFESS
jgi:hypothetical protein